MIKFPKAVAWVYCFELTKQQMLNWKEWADTHDNYMNNMMDTFPEILKVEWDFMFGSYIWVTLDSQNSLALIQEYIDRRVQ